MNMKPCALILHATGTNRDHDAAEAFEMAGANVEIVHLNQLRRGERRLADFQILALAGGFSYADALGAGKLLALDLQVFLAEEVGAFIESGRPVIGICNGFQALVKAGILPGANEEATLTFNDCGHFECRWVTLQPVSQTCLWTRGLKELVECPVAHGEGNFITHKPGALQRLAAADQIALVYVRPDGSKANGLYPFNPNGSKMDIAGICNPEGNVLGLMPHPENNVLPFQYPHWMRGVQHSGLPLFENAVRYVNQKENPA